MNKFGDIYLVLHLDLHCNKMMILYRGVLAGFRVNPSPLTEKKHIGLNVGK